MNRRKFLVGLGAALLVIPFLPAPLRAMANEWRWVGRATVTVKMYDDGSVSVGPMSYIDWSRQRIPE